VENSSIDSAAIAGIYIDAPDPTVEDNSATNDGFVSGNQVAPAFSVTSSTLNPALLGGNTATGGEPLFQLGGTVGWSGTLPSGGVPWFINGNGGKLDIPQGLTLTVAPGAIMKLQGGFDCAGSCFYSPTITVEGTLDAVGTASSPITFTSFNDNSIGGTTGSGSPAAGNWADVTVTGSGSIDLEHAAVDYSAYGVNVSTTGSAVVENSSIEEASRRKSVGAFHVSMRARGISCGRWRLLAESTTTMAVTAVTAAARTRPVHPDDARRETSRSRTRRNSGAFSSSARRVSPKSP